MQSPIALAIRAYRHSPLHPSAGRLLMRGLGALHGALGQTRVPHDLGGFEMELDLSEMIDARLYYTGEWEPESVRTLQRVLTPGATAIDVGAQIGYLSLVMGQCVGRGGKVLALEPSQWSFERLVRNLERNRYEQVQALRLAAGEASRSGIRGMLPNGFPLAGHITATEQEFDLTTLDDLVEQHGLTRLDLIKIDTDGFDDRVLRGARRTLATLSPVVLFEVAPWYLAREGAAPTAPLDEVRAAGYRVVQPGSFAPFDDAWDQARARTTGSFEVVALPPDFRVESRPA